MNVQDIKHAIEFGLHCQGVEQVDEQVATEVADYVVSQLVPTLAHPEMVPYDHLLVRLYEYQLWERTSSRPSPAGRRIARTTAACTRAASPTATPIAPRR